MKQMKTIFALTAMLSFNYLAGAVVFAALQHYGLSQIAELFPEMALGFPILVAQLAAIKYANTIKNSLI